jgi:uncharacterized membrane protein
MKQTKFVIIAAGVLGIIACFLPYISEGPLSMSMWDFRQMPGGNSGLINGPKQVYIALAMFAIPALLAATALASRLQRALAGVAAVSFLATFALELVRKGMTGEGPVSTAIGGKLVFVAALVGFVASVVAVAKPEE